MPSSYLTCTPNADAPDDCLEWFSDQTVRQEVVEYESCIDLYMPATPYVEAATGCVRFQAWDNCAGGDDADGLYRLGEPYVQSSTGCVKVRVGWEDECRCEEVCPCNPVVFRVWTNPTHACFDFGFWLDTTISPGETKEGQITWGDYTWDYVLTCEETSVGMGPCVTSWPSGCLNSCDKCHYVLTLTAVANGPGCDHVERVCVDLDVHVERPINCLDQECACTECKLISPDGTDERGPYVEHQCPLFTWVRLYLVSSM